MCNRSGETFIRTVRVILRATICLLVAGIFWPTLARSDDVSWQGVIGADPDSLSAEVKGRAAAILKKERAYHACRDTLAKCMTQEGEGGEVARRVAGFVLRQIDKGRTDAQMRTLLRERAMSVHPPKPAQIELGNSQSIGAEDAKVVIVEFAEFQCPYCREVSPSLKALVEEFDGQVRVHYMAFPVRGHDRAVPAGLAALAAGRQGKFWEYHDVAYQNRHALSDRDLVRYADRLGLDMDRFNQDIKDRELANQIRREKAEGQKHGVDSTPTLFFNGKLFRLADKSLDELRDRVAEELSLIAHREEVTQQETAADDKK